MSRLPSLPLILLSLKYLCCPSESSLPSESFRENLVTPISASFEMPNSSKVFFPPLRTTGAFLHSFLPPYQYFKVSPSLESTQSLLLSSGAVSDTVAFERSISSTSASERIFVTFIEPDMIHGTVEGSGLVL